MKHNKRAIEFSVNVIVIMVISIVILGAGLALFNKLRQGAVEYVEGVDSQTEAQLRAMMLNNNQKVSVYPSDITIERGKSAMVGLGIINTLETPQSFGIANFSGIPTPVFNPVTIANNVMYYKTPESIGVDKSIDWFKVKAIQFNSESTINLRYPSYNIRQLIIKNNVAPKEQIFKNVLITVPDKQSSGLYVIKLNILNSSTTDGRYCKGITPMITPTPAYPCNIYGIVKIYVNVP
jgi:hypothetical protein